MPARLTRRTLRAMALGLALALLAQLTGCATLRGILNPAAERLAAARGAIERKELDAAYRDLAEIRKRYPESEECREAFPLAAKVFKVNYHRDRFRSPDSPFVTTEPGFMLDWFVALLAAPEFPKADAEALFVGMPFGYFRDFLALLESRPEASRWSVAAFEDNGIIESVTGTARASLGAP